MITVHNRKRCGCSEINGDDRAGVECRSRNCIRNAVTAECRWIVELYFQSGFDAGTDDQRLFADHAHQRFLHGRCDRRHDRRKDASFEVFALQAVHLENRPDQNGVFKSCGEMRSREPLCE